MIEVSRPIRTGPDDAYDLLRSVAVAQGFTILEEDATARRLLLRRGVSGSSWGARTTIRCEPVAGGSVMTAVVTLRVPFNVAGRQVETEKIGLLFSTAEASRL